MNTYTTDDIGPFLANKGNTLQLLDWLVNGAQHTVFNIELASLVKYDEDPEDLSHFVEHFATVEERGDAENSSLEDCGTICCIAGAASQLHLGEFGSLNPTTADLDWADLEYNAFAFLGLDYDFEDYWGEGSMWGFFDPGVWTGSDATGPMAAKALVAYSQSGDWRAAVREAYGEE